MKGCSGAPTSWRGSALNWGAVAALVLLAAATRAGIVRTNLSFSGRLIAVLFSAIGNGSFGHPRPHRLLSDDWLHSINRVHDIVLDTVEQQLEHPVPLSFIDDEGIFLSVCLEPDPFAKVVHLSQMLD